MQYARLLVGPWFKYHHRFIKNKHHVLIWTWNLKDSSFSNYPPPPQKKKKKKKTATEIA